MYSIRPSIKYCIILIGRTAHSTIIFVFVFIFGGIALSIDYCNFHFRAIRSQTVQMMLLLYNENDSPLMQQPKNKNTLDWIVVVFFLTLFLALFSHTKCAVSASNRRCSRGKHLPCKILKKMQASIENETNKTKYRTLPMSKN